MLENLVAQVYNQRKRGREKDCFLLITEGRHGFSITSPPPEAGQRRLSLHGRVKATRALFSHMHYPPPFSCLRAGDVRLTPPLCYCLGHVPFFWGMVLLLSQPADFVAHLPS